MSHIDGALAGVDFFFSDAIMKKGVWRGFHKKMSRRKL